MRRVRGKNRFWPIRTGAGGGELQRATNAIRDSYYYFREKKSTPNVNDTEKKQRNYINMDSEVIQSMDAHLLTIMNEPNFKPAIGYDLFCAQHIDILRNEIMRLIKENPAIKDTPEKLSSKIKKTYKNRYFILSQQED